MRIKDKKNWGEERRDNWKEGFRWEEVEILNWIKKNSVRMEWKVVKK